MKILYLGVSSKYIHTMPAGWFLSEYLKEKGIGVKEIYHNINKPCKNILDDVIKQSPDVLLLSVYIFNVNLIRKLIFDIRKSLPLCKIIIGGPEADISLDADKIIFGEGERALYEYLKGKTIDTSPIENLDDIPSPYTFERLANSKNKMIYYESSRGCPFTCSYCMAALTKGVRYFSLERVKKDLKTIVKGGAKIIKFTDRTFNADTKRTNAILQFIALAFEDCDVCFHFEVGGDLFHKSTLDILRTFPKGLAQMEAGVQSLNKATLKAVNRVFDKEKFVYNIEKIISFQNIHMHLDLIAGLPLEDKESFISSFNQTIALRPHMLQLGFLKFLKGAPIRKTYDAKYKQSPPYEIISSEYMSEDDLKELKKVEYIVDKLYNTNRFHFTLKYLFDKYNSPYQIFKEIADFFEEKNLYRGMSMNTIYETMLQFLKNSSKAKDLLRLDFIVTNNSRKTPYPLRKPYLSDFKRFLQQRPKDRDTLYEYFEYLPEKNKGEYIVKVDYTKKDKVTSLYDWKIID